MKTSPWSVHAPLRAAPAWSEQPAPTARPSTHPDWFRDVRRKYWFRVYDWASQAWAITVAPHRFLTEWVDGERETLNPFRFFAVGTTASFLIDRAGRKLLHIASAPSQGVMGFLNSSSGTTLLVFLFAAILHVVLRLKSRAPLRSSVAAVMFTSAGPGTFLSLVGWLAAGGIYLVNGHVDGALYNGAFTPWPVIGLGCAGFGWALMALVGVHRVRWWWSLVALAAAPFILGFATAAVLLPLQFFAPKNVQVGTGHSHPGGVNIGVTVAD